MAKILITGGTGLIGTQLSQFLVSKGHEVNIASRRQSKVAHPFKGFLLDTEKNYLDSAALDGVEYIVNLAGEGIADKHWTPQRKHDLIQSRTKPVEILTEHLKKRRQSIKGFVGASAIGYYGAVTVPTIFNESDAPGTDFMAQTCVAWENAYKEISTLVQHTNLLRIGVVLTDKGGALKKMSAPFKLGFGAALGSGAQYMPWIHLDDLVQLIHDALFGKLEPGIYNAVATEHITNKEFSAKLAQALGKPFFLPNVPALAMNLALGEMAVMLLEGSRVSNEKVLKAGFKLRYPTLKEALTSLT